MLFVYEALHVLYYNDVSESDRVMRNIGVDVSKNTRQKVIQVAYLTCSALFYVLQ